MSRESVWSECVCPCRSQVQLNTWKSRVWARQVMLITFLRNKKAYCVPCIRLSFLSKKANIWGVEHSLRALSAHHPTHTERASPYFANTVCGERKPLLQMVLLSALSGGFLSSLVVMMAPTFSVSLLSCTFPFLSVFYLALTDPESTKTHLYPHLFSATEKRWWLLSHLSQPLCIS